MYNPSFPPSKFLLEELFFYGQETITLNLALYLIVLYFSLSFK